MAERQYGFKTFRLFKNEALGTGSYGAVYKAKCDQLLCAAKLLHPVLFQMEPMIPGKEHRQPLRRFEEECRLLSRINHPNIVQYLGTSYDPETNTPVLLMELMDESLTYFLESSPGDLPYHTQVNLSYDIAQALAFLHSNRIIHCNLSSNNVLLHLASTRAKIADFGMSKLTDLNATQLATMTTCPGTPAYMSPEALNEPPLYRDKLDNFSFGVLLAQIITQEFPNPTNRYRLREFIDPRLQNQVIQARVLVTELERRQAHIDLIPPDHPLLPTALHCLKDNDSERPTATQLCKTLTALKRTARYQESSQQDLYELYEGQLQPQNEAIAQKDEQIQEYQEIIAQQNADLEANQELYYTIVQENKQLSAIQKTLAQNNAQLQAKHRRQKQAHRDTIVPNQATQDDPTLQQYEAEFDPCNKLGDLGITDTTKYTVHIGKCLGKGGFGEVFKIQMPNQKMFAAKFFCQHFVEEKNITRELQNLRMCSHEHIIKHFATCKIEEKSEKPVLIMELMETCLEKYCTETRHSFQHILNIQAQIAEGLQYLHQLDPMIIHRDLSARNVLLNGTDGPPELIVAKIADFGLSRTVDSVKHTITMTKLAATQHYRAPEINTIKHCYNEKVDIFSFGHLMLLSSLGKAIEEILDIRQDGHALTEIERRRPHLDKLQEKIQEETNNHPSCKDFMELVKTCLEVKPDQRPTAFHIKTKLLYILEKLASSNSSNSVISSNTSDSRISSDHYDGIN